MCWYSVSSSWPTRPSDLLPLLPHSSYIHPNYLASRQIISHVKNFNSEAIRTLKIFDKKNSKSTHTLQVLGTRSPTSVQLVQISETKYPSTCTWSVCGLGIFFIEKIDYLPTQRKKGIASLRVVPHSSNLEEEGRSPSERNALFFPRAER